MKKGEKERKKFGQLAHRQTETSSQVGGLKKK
jgi:hypothetical protein